MGGGVSEAAKSRSLFRPGLVLALLALSVFSFSAFIALAAFAPDLKSQANGGRHAWSKSAIGYSALASLLQANGFAVQKSRDTKAARKRNDWTILTPEPGARAAKMDSLMHGHVLVVLPKWTAAPDRARRSWVIGFGPLPYRSLRNQAEQWFATHLPEDKDHKRKPMLIARTKTPVSTREAETIKARQAALAEFRARQAERAEKRKAKKAKAGAKKNPDKKPATPDVAAPKLDPYFHKDGSARSAQDVLDLRNNAVLPPIDAWYLSGPLKGAQFNPDRINDLQTITWEELEPVIANGEQILLGKLKNTPRNNEIYVLADPDLLNNMGVLGSPDTMRAGMSMFDRLVQGKSRILFDMTLHGYGKNLNLIKTLLMPPFLGVTLCALAAGLLMAWGAWYRFGPVQAETAPFAAGKRELVENSAALIRLANREPRMLAEFADLTRNIAAREAGAPKGMGQPELDALLARMARNAGVNEDFDRLYAQAQAGRWTREDVLRISRKLVQWRTELKQ